MADATRSRRPAEVLLTWALDRNGARVPIGALDPRARGARAPFSCVACGEPLVARLGAIRAHHFAHRPGSACALTRPETLLHFQAKQRLLFLCGEAFGGRLRVRVGARCPSCRRDLGLDLAALGDAAVEEGAAGGLRADVLVTRAGAPAMALEVKVTHAVDEGKRDALARAALPAIEIDAREPWEEEHPDGVAVRVARTVGVPACSACEAAARAAGDRALGGEAAEVAELEAYRARGLMGPPPGPALAATSAPLSAEELASLHERFRCPECGRDALATGQRLVRHPCASGLRPVAWRGYDGMLVELAWWRQRHPARHHRRRDADPHDA